MMPQKKKELRVRVFGRCRECEMLTTDNTCGLPEEAAKGVPKARLKALQQAFLRVHDNGWPDISALPEGYGCYNWAPVVQDGVDPRFVEVEVYE